MNLYWLRLLTLSVITSKDFRWNIDRILDKRILMAPIIDSYPVLAETSQQSMSNLSLYSFVGLSLGTLRSVSMSILLPTTISTTSLRLRFSSTLQLVYSRVASTIPRPNTTAVRSHRRRSEHRLRLCSTLCSAICIVIDPQCPKE